MSGNGITLAATVVRPDKQDEYIHYLGSGDGSGPDMDFAPLNEILEMEIVYKELSINIANIVEVELAQLRAEGDTSVLPTLETMAREMRFRESLIARKFGSLLSARDIAFQRFSHTQVERFFDSGRLPQINRRVTGVNTRQAFTALFNAKLLVEGIGLLNSQSDTVRGVIAIMQAQEADRIAQAQSRLAAEHARQVALEQTRIAQEQARRLAEELARVAAENEARRVAQEQARIAAQMLEQQRAEEHARLEAAEQVKRLLEEQRQRRDQAFRAANTYLMRGGTAHAQLVFTTANGAVAVAVAEGAMAGLQAAIRSAIAALSGLVAGTTTGFMVGVGALIYSPELANGELPERYMFSYPLADLTNGPLPTLTNWQGTAVC